MTTPAQPRVASLLPSATEMVCAVGARAGLVGRSHECDHPADVSPVPVLTRPRRALPRASAAIDRAVRDLLADAVAVYEVDIPELARRSPHSLAEHARITRMPRQTVAIRRPPAARAPSACSAALWSRFRELRSSSLPARDSHALGGAAGEISGLEAARPDVIVTQDLCDVCAVSLDDVRTALCELARSDVQICSLRPTRLQDVWDDVRRVGDALGRPAEAEAAAVEFERRCAGIAERASALDRPSVLTIEWLDPVMVGGTWMPELAELAGGRALVTRPGDHAPTLAFDELADLQPDVVLIKPCGFDLHRTTEELHLLADNLPWQIWDCVRQQRIYVADGNAFFNRPGPRLVESLEILAAIVHPEAFADLQAQHARSFRRVTSDLELLAPSAPQ